MHTPSSLTSSPPPGLSSSATRVASLSAPFRNTTPRDWMAAQVGYEHEPVLKTSSSLLCFHVEPQGQALAAFPEPITDYQRDDVPASYDDDLLQDTFPRAALLFRKSTHVLNPTRSKMQRPSGSNSGNVHASELLDPDTARPASHSTPFSCHHPRLLNGEFKRRVFGPLF